MMTKSSKATLFDKIGLRWYTKIMNLKPPGNWTKYKRIYQKFAYKLTISFRYRA